MKIIRKITFITLIALLSISALGILTSVKAASDINYQVTISSNNKSVSEDASYTFILSNTGTDNLGAINITIPAYSPGGYMNIQNLAITQQPPSQTWNITHDNEFILLSGSQGLSTGQTLTFIFDAKNPQLAGTYQWNVAGSNETGAAALNAPQTNITATSLVDITTILPALAIMGIAGAIALLNSGLNRVLINYFIGWQQYRVMQKEMAEYRSETMAAARANDKKQMEKLKKKQSQINAMQGKMMKPQMVQFGISFLYIIVWFLVLTPTFGGTSMAFIPGFGPISVFYLYPIFSLFLGLISSRIIGIMPIEQ
jgi:uncharacterized membrane protein (DUF106 family)